MSSAQYRAIYVGAVPRPEHRHRSVLMVTKRRRPQPPRSGRFEADFFRERLFDLAAEISASIASTSGAGTWSCAMKCPTSSPPSIYGTRPRNWTARYLETLDKCLREFDWGKNQAPGLAGRTDGIGGSPVGCFVEGGGSGAA